MRNDSPKKITLPRVVARHVQAYIDEIRGGKAIFARQVREHHEANYINASVHWSRNPEAPASMLRDGEKLFRYLDNEENPKFPGEILESIIASLPADRRYALQSELAERQGLLAVPIPSVSGSADADNLGRLAKEVGEAITSIAPMLEDGVINELDKEQAAKALNEIRQAQGVLQEMAERIERQALGKGKPSLAAVKA